MSVRRDPTTQTDEDPRNLKRKRVNREQEKRSLLSDAGNNGSARSSSTNNTISKDAVDTAME